ncbi:MAG TPA: hypothetical protein V6C46_06320 [Coleofasciculaceae cyanobacterium]
MTLSRMTAVFTATVVTLVGIAPAIAQYVPPKNPPPDRTVSTTTRMVDTPPPPENRGSGR